MTNWESCSFSMDQVADRKAKVWGKKKGGIAIVDAIAGEDDFELYCLMLPSSGKLLGWLCCAPEKVEEIVDELVLSQDWTNASRAADLSASTRQVWEMFQRKHMFFRKLPESLRPLVRADELDERR